MSFSGAPAGTAATMDNYNNSLMMFADNSQPSKQSGQISISNSGSPQSNMHSSSGKMQKHRLQAMKKVIESRNPAPKNNYEKMQQKSAEIINRGELIPRTPSIPMPEKKPELQILSSVRNSPSSGQQRKTPLKTPKGLETTPG